MSRILEAVSLDRLPASAIDAIRIEQHGDLQVLEHQMDERLRRKGPQSALAIDIEKAKRAMMREVPSSDLFIPRSGNNINLLGITTRKLAVALACFHWMEILYPKPQQ
jgi:hypothetical protein